MLDTQYTKYTEIHLVDEDLLRGAGAARCLLGYKPSEMNGPPSAP